MLAYLTVFGISAGTAFIATPLVRRLAVRVGAVVQPSDRKVHLVPTPTMGGIAMYGGFVAGLAASRVLPYFREMNANSTEPGAALAACSLIVALGVVDDLRGITWLTKLTGQIFTAGVLILVGVQVTYLWLPGSIYAVSSDLAVPLTVLWVVAIVNAVNLVDGLDGLAAGMMAIAAGAFFIYMIRSPGIFASSASPAGLLSVITLGICVGFLPWNFNPARIFMGDSGAMLLGMLVSIATLSGVAGRNPFLGPVGGDFAAVSIPLLVPLLVLAVPFLDVLLAIGRRMRRGVGIGVADKEHLHHRLLDIGHSQRQAVFLMYLWSALLSGSALAVGLIDGRLAAGAVLLGALILFLITALPRLTERRRNGEPPPAGTARKQESARPGR